MATNKNQHFVPRCYLKAFTQDGQNLAINLLNLDLERCIPLAPVKSQCSGDYFYGQDAILENAIQAVEQGYAKVVERIHLPGYRLTDGDRSLLRIFILFQHMRTEAASRRSVEIFDGMEHVVGQEVPDFKPSIKESVQMAMRTFAETMHILDDLKVCIFRNKTGRPFITSDDPAVMTNRWHMEDARVRRKSPGIVSCGAVFFFPISPRMLCLAFDGDVYSVPHEAGWVDVRNVRDVEAINQHQLLSAQANIYFREWEHRDWLLSCCRNISHMRLPSRHRINYAVLDRVEGDHKVYRTVNSEEVGDHTEALIHSQSLLPKPASWPSQLKWRSRGYVYTNGTGAGYVRAAHTAHRASTGFWKEPSKK